MLEKKSFILYTDYEVNFNLLSQNQKGDLMDAIFAYTNGKELEELDPIVQMAFTFIKNNLDRDIEKWNNRAEKSRANGKKGGRPKNPTPKKSNLPSVVTPQDDKNIDKINSLEKLRNYKPETDAKFGEWCKNNGITELAFIYRKMEDIIIFCESNGRKYKDYVATLKAWLRKDISQQHKLKERVQGAKSLFDVGANNGDLDWENN